MYIKKAVIEYNVPLEVEADEMGMTIVQKNTELSLDETDHSIYIIPDELRELNELAKLLGWEEF